MIQRWIDDQVPQIIMAGGASAAHSIASAGASIGAGLGSVFDRLAKQREKEKDRLLSEAKLSKHFQGVLDVLDADTPEAKAANVLRSPSEKEGRAVALYQKRHM